MVTGLNQATAGLITGNIGNNTERLRASLEATASGNRINRALQDIAALSVATSLQTETSSLRAAQTNVSQASSFLQVADGGLSNIGGLLDRAASLAVQSQSGALSDSARQALDSEFQSLLSEIDRTASNTSFNGNNLLDGSQQNQSPIVDLGGAGEPQSTRLDFNDIQNGDVVDINGVQLTAGADFAVGGTLDQTVGNLAAAANANGGLNGDATFSGVGDSLEIEAIAGQTLTVNSLDSTADVQINNPSQFQVGSNSGDTIEVGIGDSRTSALFGGQSLSLADPASAAAALDAVGAAIDNVVSQRAEVGSLQSRLNSAASNIDVAIQNQEAARANLADTDIAEASTETAQAQVARQASISLLAQSNRLQSNVLDLIS